MDRRQVFVFEDFFDFGRRTTTLYSWYIQRSAFPERTPFLPQTRFEATPLRWRVVERYCVRQQLLSSKPETATSNQSLSVRARTGSRAQAKLVRKAQLGIMQMLFCFCFEKERDTLKDEEEN